VIVSFGDAGTEDVFHGRDTKAARRACPSSLRAIARRKLDQLNAAVSLASLRLPPGNRLESLKGNRTGQFGIRIDDQFRICFAWTEAGPAGVEIADYH
jgi:proteic killer suppression protein